MFHFESFLFHHEVIYRFSTGVSCYGRLPVLFFHVGVLLFVLLTVQIQSNPICPVREYIFLNLVYSKLQHKLCILVYSKLQQ